MKRKLFTMILTVLLVVSLIPTAVLVAESSVQVLVEPTMEYTSISAFSEGLAIAQKDGKHGHLDTGKWGFIDKAGKVVIPFEYDEYEGEFSEGLSAVRKGGKSGYIDKTGEVIIPLIYNDAYSFSEGLAAVQKEGKYGYINKRGEIVIPFLYDSADAFSDGLANVIKYDDEESWEGYIDKTGEMVITLNNMAGWSFSEGLAAVVGDSLNGKGLKWGFIDKSGKLVIPLQYDNPGNFSEGFAGVAKDGKWGYIDKTGKVVIPFEYQSAFDYSEGLAAVNGQDGCKYIDKTGKVAFSNIYGTAGLFSDGFAWVTVVVEDSEGFIADVVRSLIDKAGELILPPENEYSRVEYAEGLAVVQQNGKWGILQIAAKPTKWAQFDVARAISLDLVPDNLQFKYIQATTRAEFCALAAALYEKYTGMEIAERINFDDTSDVNVEKMAAVGVVNGVGNSMFAPDDELTREQAAVVIARLAEVIGKSLDLKVSTFNDNNLISTWAIKAVGQMQAVGIMGGVGNDIFAPKNPYTREQSIITIIRLWDIVKS